MVGQDTFGADADGDGKKSVLSVSSKSSKRSGTCDLTLIALMEDQVQKALKTRHFSHLFEFHGQP